MKNKLLKFITYVISIVFVFSGCCLDSESHMPIVVCGLCLLWIVPFSIVNRKKGGDVIDKTLRSSETSS